MRRTSIASSSVTGTITSQNVDTATEQTDTPEPASWAAMPEKQQLALIVITRFCETLADSSLQSYIVFQLRSFAQLDGSAPSTAKVAFQLSILRASVATPQLFTSTLWGILADHPRVGRKLVIVMGLVTVGIGSFGLAFTRSFAGAVLCRLLVGLTGGNKAAMRSMVREISGEKFESRAVLLLPAAFNVGSVIGPMLGGILAQGAVSSKGGMQWFPGGAFALPNIVNGMMLLGCAILINFRLHETLPDAGSAKTERRVRVSIVPEWAKRLYGRYSQKPQYGKLASREHGLDEREDCESNAESHVEEKQQHMSIWTRRLILTLAARALLLMHVFTYPSLLLVFASTPRYQPDEQSGIHRMATVSTRSLAVGGSKTNGTSPFVHVPPGYHPHAPFTFTGGLAFKPLDIAIAFAIRGVVGLLLQLLFFPYLRDVFGTLRLYRYALAVFPLTYFITPYLATIGSSTLPPLPAAGVPLWATLAAILVLQSTARSLALPAGAMLLNAACPDRSVLGTVNGIGQSVSAAARTIGQLLLTGWLYGVGLEAGVVGVAWWAMAGMAIAAAVAAASVPADGGENEKK